MTHPRAEFLLLICSEFSPLWAVAPLPVGIKWQPLGPSLTVFSEKLCYRRCSLPVLFGIWTWVGQRQRPMYYMGVWSPKARGNFGGISLPTVRFSKTCTIKMIVVWITGYCSIDSEQLSDNFCSCQIVTIFHSRQEDSPQNCPLSWWPGPPRNKCFLRFDPPESTPQAPFRLVQPFWHSLLL